MYHGRSYLIRCIRFAQYLVYFTWYTWCRGPTFVFWVRREDSFGFQVLGWAVLSMSARINDEDDVPLVIVCNDAHFSYSCFWVSEFVCVCVFFLRGVYHGIWHFTIKDAINAWSSAEQGGDNDCSTTRLWSSIAGSGVRPTASSSAYFQRRVEINNVRSEKQHADFLTKPLQTEAFRFHRLVMNLWWFHAVICFVVYKLNPSFYPTSAVPLVSFLILHPREIQIM